MPHFVAQGYANWNGLREGGWVKTEDDPLDLHESTPAYTSMAALRHVEDVVGAAGGAVLRYGAFYGPGATDDQVTLVRQRKFPLVGAGTGYASWVHLDDAASATVLAVEQKATPGAIFRDRDGKIVNTWTLDLLDGQIHTISSVINPDKLAHVGPVADAWAVLGEANQSRHLGN